MTGPSPDETLRNRMLAGQAAAAQRSTPDAHRASRLSGLSVNENLLLGSIGWESIDLSSGAAVWGMRRDTINTWGADQDRRASLALGEAMRAAVDRLEANCRMSGGHGVIGVDIRTEIEPRYVSVNLLGTAVRPDGSSKVPDRAFTSNLTPQAFVLLKEAGWTVLGLTSGCQFVRSYRRSAVPNGDAESPKHRVDESDPGIGDCASRDNDSTRRASTRLRRSGCSRGLFVIRPSSLCHTCAVVHCLGHGCRKCLNRWAASSVACDGRVDERS